MANVKKNVVWNEGMGHRLGGKVAPPAEKDEVPMQAEVVVAEASATSAGGEELGQCYHFGKKGDKNTWCQNMATTKPYSKGVNSHLVYCEACNDTRKQIEK